MASGSDFDCAVVGLGGHGAAALAHLARAGVRVLGLERFELTHGNGSSHGKSRIYRQAYFEHPSYVPLLQRSLELWRELKTFYEEETGDLEQPLLNMCGGIMIGKPNETVVAGTLRAIAEHGLPHEVLSAEQIRARFPVFQPAQDEIGIFEPNAGTLHPEKCILAHVLMAEKHGAVVRCGEAMTTFSRDAEGRITVTTDRGAYTCRKLVLAVGAWAPGVFNEVLPPAARLHLERRVLFWFRPRNPELDWRGMPVYIWDRGQRNFYGFPEDSTLPGAVKIAQHSLYGQHGEARLASPEQVLREVTDDDVASMRAAFREQMPALDGELVEARACMYTMTPDEHFLVDLHPQDANVVLASPCSGHGYKFCSVVGEVIRDLVTRGHTGHDISLFRIAARGP